MFFADVLAGWFSFGLVKVCMFKVLFLFCPFHFLMSLLQLGLVGGERAVVLVGGGMHGEYIKETDAQNILLDLMI